jgi:hypothetical protein
MRTLFIAVLAVALAPSLALAGGGSKPNSTVKVKNNGTDTLAVIVDPNSNVQTSLSSGTLNTQTFLNAGGRFVGPSGTATFGGLRAGSHSVVAAFVSGTSSGSSIATGASTTINATKGKTVTVTATGSTETGTTLSP